MGCGSANDEWQCVNALGQDAADAAFKKHWDSWTTKDDISQIKSLGLNTVRIPVGFWLKEDLVYDGEYYPRGALQYLDRLVGWCADAGIYVIMDVHGGPGVQTPNQQFTGHSVSYPGFYTQDNYERANKFLEWMAERIHMNNSYRTVGTLQVMNEPVHASDYGSLAADMIANFYPNAWTRIRSREDQLGVSLNDRLHIQMMVCLLRVHARGANMYTNAIYRTSHGAQATLAATSPTPHSRSTTTTGTTSGTGR